MTRPLRIEEEALEDYARRSLIERWQALLSRRATAEAAIGELRGQAPPEWQEKAADETMASMFQRLSEDEWAQLRQVTEAIRRLDEGTYGSCLSCGSPIAEERLRAVPEAARCAGCTNHH